MTRESATSARKLLAAERAARAFKLRVEDGKTYAEIAGELGMSRTAVQKALKLSLKKNAALSAEMVPEYREQEREKLDKLWSNLQPMLGSTDAATQLKAIDSGVKLSARYAALFGLDGAQKIEAKVGIDDARGELADLVARITARAREAGTDREPQSGGG